MSERLWEIEHPYYCNEGNYFAGGREQPNTHYKSWADFYDEFKDADFDMNLLFRWDWEIATENEDGEPITPKDDPYYRDGTLKVFWIGQRKGLYFWSTVEVCRADEPAVIAFLKPRLEHLKRLWEPLS